MNKRIIILIICVFSFCFIDKVSALEVNQKGYINKKGVEYYSEANYSGEKVLNTLDTGDQVSLLDTNLVASNDTTRCSSGFYRVSFYWAWTDKTYTGYVCSNRINFSIDTAPYREEFANSNIPEIYWEKLALLKSSHPSWKFTGYNTGLNWNDVLNAESQVGMSYIQSSNPIYLSLDPGSYDSASKTYMQREAGGWYAANKNTVAYYMDPRNFLDEINIFAFENLGYNSTYQTKQVVENIFKNTDLFQYADYYINAASFEGNSISPISLAARSRQEVVLGTGKLSDSANGGSGVYNFYNLGAFSSCSNPVLCALDFARGYNGEYTSYNRPWDSAEKAILNGAKYIADGYINAGQNTLYFQRWNVTNRNTYSHQYMTNISAPISEGKSTYDAYSSIDGLLDSAIEFIIPVYNGMPSEISNLPTSVDQTKINELNTNTNMSDVINKSGYSYNDSYIVVPLNTTATHMITAIKTAGGNASVTRDGNGMSGQEALGTADIVNVTVGSETRSFRVIVKGDVNGDGSVSAIDYVKVRKHLMNSGSLTGSFAIAADINNDGNIGAIDYVKIRKYIMGTGTL